MSRPLAIILPTIGRWPWLAGFTNETGQLQRLADQMDCDDRLILILDSPDDDPPAKFFEALEAVGSRRTALVSLAYDRPKPPTGCVNRAHNAGVALAPESHDILELDDHDLLADGALAAIKQALADGADYVYGWHARQAIIDGPRGEAYLERWPDVLGDYAPGAFLRREVEAINPRAFTRRLWDQLGGWRTDAWPGGDYDFATRAEASGAKIVCIQQVLCTATIDPAGISGSYGGGRDNFAAAAS